MELWDVLDENRNKTGKLIERGQPLKPDEYHLVVFAFIRNSTGQFVISKRSPEKTFPNTWEITGGSAVTGDDSYSAVVREVKEELGVDLIGKGSILRSTKHDGEHPYFSDIWLFEQDVELQDIICQVGEVSEAKIVSKDEIKKLIEQGIFMNGNPSIIECLEYV